MATQTLLEMTQTILSALDSDEVNSISDTVEAQQVAKIIQNKYYDILTRGNIPAQKVLLQLDPSNDVSLPTLMYVPDNVTNIDWIKYFDSDPDDGTGDDFDHGVNEDLEPSEDDAEGSPPGYKYVTQLSVEGFLDMVNRFNPNDEHVHSYTFTEGSQDFTFFYVNDKQPQFCTVIENRYILFDSYDSEFDDTLQASKTLAYGIKLTPFLLEDSFVPDLDDNQFPLLLNEAKSLAFYELKQMPHVKAEQEIKRQWNAVQKNKAVFNRPSAFAQLPDFGRVPRTGGYSGGGYGVYKWMRQAGP